MVDEYTAPWIARGAVLSWDDRPDLCLVVRYDGTDYHGFQKQAAGATIQGELERVLTALLGAGEIVGASRTDAGVHACGQVVVWRGPVQVPIERIAMVANRKLPRAIQIVQAWWVPSGWDPRRAARAKQYSYRLWRAPGPPDLHWHRFVQPSGAALSWQRLQRAAALFEGTHDFWAFRTEGAGVQSTIRTIFASRWIIEEKGNIWRYQVVGNGFLYRMVRHMVGSMICAAEPQGSLKEIESSLGRGTHKVAPLAPARGLMLDWIDFGNEEGFGHVSGSRVGTRG
ncbi:MAG: tRNA pseudouridine(38-40) synthase TruA [Sulfobacillus acidophilus]|uniref:tRNA pseudouridine synthase A n=1 Tax=Sulfobacillus acidophilus TaxID=53633 RepID=A0A2T2WGL2_9FIRM|nr:MAG: tRNA pseudouridine(38-40) synthase TruA [Sulfobacillus acidophilus]